MPLKRKRNDRPSGDGGRPSPHRPGDASLAQHERDDNFRGRGRGYHRGGANRRDSGQGFGRGGHNRQHSQSSPGRGGGHRSPQAPSPSPTTRGPQAQQPQTKPLPSPTQNSNPSRPVSAGVKPSQEQVPSTTSSNRPPYVYNHLSDDVVNGWANNGRSQVVNHGVQSRKDVDITELSCLFQEFINAVVDKRLDPSDAGACVKEILGDERSDAIKDSYAFAPHDLFLDTLAIIVDNDADIYHPSIREFLISTGVSPSLMRQILDAPILQQLGLIRDTFAKIGVRQATNLLYRQANYNLLREETEGYSKLITELFSTNTASIPPVELPAQTFERVKGLIGTFDLDVGRVLDVTLDVAAAVLIKQFKFFVKFLRVSSWWPRSGQGAIGEQYFGGLPVWAAPEYPLWTVTDEDDERVARLKLEKDRHFWDRARELQLPAFFEIGGRRILGSDSDRRKSVNGYVSDGSGLDTENEWVKETQTLPPAGNRVAAQLLGFKLRFYNSELRDASDVLPANLLYLAALLIKIGFISLVDLYPHLSPADDGMERIRDEELKKNQLAERAARGGGMNALLMAGVLPQGEDDNPAPSGPVRKEPAKKVEVETKQTPTDDGDKKKLPEPLEQKVSLLIQLLTIGAIPEALFILGRFPWIPETFPDVLDRLHRILHVAVNSVYNDARPTLGNAADIPTKELPNTDQSGVAKGSVRLSRLPQRKIWRWPFPDKADTNENQNYRFYWDEWADNIPICQTVDDIFTLCGTLLNVSGVNIGRDESLLSKLAVIGAKSLARDNSEVNLNRWHDLLRRLLLPALSHTKANASVVNAVWDLLRHYPLVTRYSMYAEWFEGQISRLPAMKAAFARATAETRGTMKRVSLTNLSEMAKQLAKTSYSSPGIVFRVALEQLESYPNLIDAFVECAKYFTDLSYDVLVWSLMSSLGKSRSRTQADHALTTSKWLTALSRFSGKVFRRYSLLNPTPVLQYVNDQLFRGNSTDLIILKEFVSSMGGIVDAVDFNDNQMLSMAGGSFLKRQTLIRGQDKRFENAKSSKRLIQALTDSKLATRFLINLAQYRQAFVFQVPEDEAHIKYLSSIIDDSHQILVQYLDFLWSNMDSNEFDVLIPSIPELMTSYGLDTSLAFLVGRATLTHRMFPWKPKKIDKIKENVQANKSVSDKDGDISMSDVKAANENLISQDEGSATTNQTKSDDPSLIPSTLQPVIDMVQDRGRPETWQKISPELYVTFWAMQLGDLFCPEDMYKQERERVEGESTALTRDRSDMTRRGQDRKNEKKSELMAIRIGLLDEGAEHLLRNARWKVFLIKQFQSAFPDPQAKSDSVSDILLEQCFLPRVLLSPADAEYTYRYIKALHEWNAPGFRLKSLYDRLFNANRLRSLIFTSTVREAEYLGRFLKLILEDLSRWHKNETPPAERESKSVKDQPRLGSYDKEGRGTADQPRLGFALTVDENGRPDTFVDHAQFRDLLFRWHKNLNIALKSCLGGTEWMHIRNGITILKSVLDFFPAVDFMASQFSTQLQKISKQEAASKPTPSSEEGDRVDLSVAAQGALSELQKRKSKWVMVQAFRPNAVGSSQAETDRSSGANTNLRPTAPDFTPQSNRGPKENAEEEDGEVQDGKDGRLQSSIAQSNEVTPSDSLPAKPSTHGREVAKTDDPSFSGPHRSSTPVGPRRSGPNANKGDGRPPSLPDRPAHHLPTRPDVPIPGHYTSERYPQSRAHDRKDGRDNRETPHARPVRDPRDQWDVKESLREPRDHRDSRGPERDRSGRLGGEHSEHRGATDLDNHPTRSELPPRPGPGPHHHDRERPHRGGRQSDRQGGTQVPSPAPPSNSGETQEPAMNPERAALFNNAQPERPNRHADSERGPRGRRAVPVNDGAEGLNPDRTGYVDPNDGNPSRMSRDEARGRGPRGQSPRRSGRQGHDGPGFEDRHDRPIPPHSADSRNQGPGLRDRSPGGHFRDRGADRDMERGQFDKVRDAAGFGPSASRGPDQDQNYGRLNPIPTGPEVPSGPRGRGRGASRNNQGASSFGNTSNRPDERFPVAEGPRAVSPDRQPPTGPSSSSRGRRVYEHNYEHGNGPATPSGPPGSAKSDRMRGFGGSDFPTPSSANGTPQGGIHPDRMAHLGVGPQHQTPPPPPPPQGPPPHSHNRHSMGSMNTPDRPGPNPRHSSGTHGPNQGMQSGVPSGSSTTHERGRGGGRRQIAGINNMLQQAQVNTPDSGRTSSGRVHQPRQTLGNSDAQVLTGGSPGPSASERGASNGDEGQGTDSGRGRRDRESRSNRPSRRSSRDRERSPGRERETAEHSERRDRRSMGGADGASRGSGHREDRRFGQAGRESTGGRDPRPRGEGSGPRNDEWVDNTKQGRSGPRDGNPGRHGERREPRDERNRKRRGEEQPGADASEREKRPRL